MVEAAVLETARGGILRAGLGFDLCDVAVVTNIGEGDHLGLADIDTIEKLAKVKRCIVEAVSPEGYAVLKADDPQVAEMAEYCPGSVIFFAQRADDLTIARHRRAGGRAVFVECDTIMLAEGSNAMPLVSLSDVPLTHGGRIGFQVENALSSAAAAWALDLPLEVIRAALESFAGDMEKVPGRFNLLDIRGATVIVDYGHNVSSLQAMIEAIDQFPHQRRTAVYTAAGDRRDVDMIRQGELLGDSFDRVILYEDHYVRGRQTGEIMGLLRRGVTAGQRTSETQEILGAVKAVEAALRSVRPGELLLVQADEIDETVNFIQSYLASTEACREIDMIQALEVPATPAPSAGATVYASPVVD
jgi:cyanophycin synthetase